MAPNAADAATAAPSMRDLLTQETPNQPKQLFRFDGSRFKPTTDVPEHIQRDTSRRQRRGCAPNTPLKVIEVEDGAKFKMPWLDRDGSDALHYGAKMKSNPWRPSAESSATKSPRRRRNRCRGRCD